MVTFPAPLLCHPPHTTNFWIFTRNALSILTPQHPANDITQERIIRNYVNGKRRHSRFTIDHVRIRYSRAFFSPCSYLAENTVCRSYVAHVTTCLLLSTSSSRAWIVVEDFIKNTQFRVSQNTGGGGWHNKVIECSGCYGVDLKLTHRYTSWLGKITSHLTENKSYVHYKEQAVNAV